MREWPNRTVSKTVVSQGTVGSNPTPSANCDVSGHRRQVSQDIVDDEGLSVTAVAGSPLLCPLALSQDLCRSGAHAELPEDAVAVAPSEAMFFSLHLPPLYDVASALPYDTHERKLRFAMRIGGDYRAFPYRSTWLEVARELALDPDALVDRVRGLAALAPDVFADAAKGPDIEALGRPLPTRLVDLVADRSERCSQLVGGSAPAAGA